MLTVSSTEFLSRGKLPCTVVDVSPPKQNIKIMFEIFGKWAF